MVLLAQGWQHGEWIDVFQKKSGQRLNQFPTLSYVFFEYINQWTNILYCMYAVLHICIYAHIIYYVHIMYVYTICILHYLQFHRTTSSPHHFLPDHVSWVSPTTSGSSTKAKAAKAQATLKSKPPKRPTVAQKCARLHHWGIRPSRGTAQRHVQAGFSRYFLTGFYWILMKSLPKRLLDPQLLS